MHQAYLFLFACLLIEPQLFAGDKPWEPIIHVTPTETLNCYMGVPLKIPYGLRIASSPVLVSHDDRYHAFVKVETVAHKCKGRQCPGRYDDCDGNTTRLYLAKDSGPFEVIFPSASPKQNHAFVHALGDDRDWLEGLRLVDWSKDNSLLLTESVSWTYDSDSGSEYHPFLYDVPKHRFEQPPVYAVLRKQFFKRIDGLECELDIRSKGFDPENNLVLSAEIKPPGYNGYAGACHHLPKTILYKLRTNTAIELPLKYQPSHYGRFVGQYKINNQR